MEVLTEQDILNIKFTYFVSFITEIGFLRARLLWDSKRNRGIISAMVVNVNVADSEANPMN